MKTLSQIRQQLVVAAQKEYDRRIDKGVHPYSMSSHNFSRVIIEKLKEHIDISDWRADNWRALNGAFEMPFITSNEDTDFSSGLWAVGAVLNSKEAWSTPGFAEAYQYHSVHGS